MIHSTARIIKVMHTASLAIGAGAIIVGTFSGIARSGDALEQQQLVDKAQMTMEAFARTPAWDLLGGS